MAHISFEESIKILKENLPSRKDCEKVFLDIKPPKMQLISVL